MFSLEGTTAITLHEGLSVGQSAHRADHGRAAAHVVLHFFHVGGGLDGNSAGIKGDGFADQAQHGRVRIQFFGRVGDDDHARGFRAALRNRKQGAHFQVGDLFFVEDIDREARFAGHGRGAIGQHARGEQVGGLVAQVAGEILRFGDDAAAGEAAIGIGARGFFPAGERGGRDFTAGLLVRFVFVVIEIREDHALDDGLRGGLAAFAFPDQERGLLHLARFQRANRGGGQPAQLGCA